MVFAQALGTHRLGQHRQLPLGHARGEELGLRGSPLRIGAGLDLRRGLRHHQPRRGQLGGRLGQAPAPALMLGQRSAEAVALPAMVQRDAQRLTDHAVAHRRDVDARTVDRAQRRLEGLARRLQQLLVVRQIALEAEAAGTDRVLAAQREGRLAYEAFAPASTRKQAMPRAPLPGSVCA